ncbi:MAG: DNA replication/repair protein RecF [Halieaceae bacterium]|jgi:DNA replication and repair protein RecF|nr:DNA replication/repair protein RecF [Halieaceae bacterium]
MSLTRLDCTGLRNLSPVSLRQLGRVNVIYGENGSGKTSLLEAVYLLGMARSFRSSNIKSVISHGQESCTVYGEVRASETAPRLTVGVTRARDGSLDARVGGQTAPSRAALVETLPLQVVHADSFSVLTGNPGSRRQFIDWGVFHVEQHFLNNWQRFQRAIKQRNNLLRRGKMRDAELAPWDAELAAAGEAINVARTRYVAALQPAFHALMRELDDALPVIELRYRRGWASDISVSEALSAARDVDIQQGFTHSGPQRADLRVLAEGRPVAEVLSRGQLKLVVCALKLAQGGLLKQSGRRCVYLVDDLTAELDQPHAASVAEILEGLDAQVFVTCIGRRDVEAIWPDARRDQAVFHVEHGKVSPVVQGSV